MLYWGEGDKKVENSQVKLSNSEPGMIKVFYLFLIEVMKIPSEKINPMEKIEALSQLIQPLTEAYKLFKGTNENTVQPLISQEVINEKMKQNFFDNIETGESINNFIKTALKKNMTKSIINTALKDIGQTVEHGPITD